MVAEIFYPPLGFGNAATKNVGTTSGTVAAGDAVVASQAAAVALAAADATAKAAAAQAAAITAAAADATAKTVGKANTSDLLGVAQDTLTALAGKLDSVGNDLTAISDASIADKIPFANTGAKHFLYSHRGSPASALLGTTSLIRNTVGSGTFGPGSADFALITSTVKDNWQAATGSAANEGEVDTLISLAYQGKKGDAAAYVAGVKKRRDNLTAVAADESGGAIIMEGEVALVNASGSEYQNMHALLGFAESPNGLSGGLGYGAYMETRAGTWFSAYHASSISLAQGAPAANAWKYYFSGAQSRDPAALNYLVDNTGRTFSGFASARMSFGFDAALNAWTLRDEPGNAERLRVARDGGGLTLTGQYAAIALVDPVTGGAAGGSHRLTSGGNGTAYYQISNSAAGWGPGGTASNIYSVSLAGFTFLANVGFNGAAPVGKQTLPAAATDAASTMALANALRTALIALGLAQ